MTAEEKEELKREILNEIKVESHDVTELETVDTLDGLTSLPAMLEDKLVLAPLSVLSKPATDAAAAIEASVELAENAASLAEKTASDARDAAGCATNAAETAETAARAASDAAKAASDALNGMRSHVVLTGDEYDALDSKDDNTIYMILEEE